MAKAEQMAGGGLKVAMERGERKGKRKKLAKLEVSRAKNGGHLVRHHYISGPDTGYQEPTEHVFGKGEGGALMAHLGRHLGVKNVPMPETGGVEDQGESPAEEAAEQQSGQEE